VPSLVGLALVDAEGLARRAGIAIYVERVAGHPIGRVLTQEPVAGSARTPGDVVKVRVTAGGDAPGQAPPPPSVGVRDVIVPDVLDRQPLQARRILEDMGLVVTEEEATSGPPGRVVDQIPSVGDVVPKGTVVRIRVTPVAAPIVRPPAPSPSAPAPEVRTPAAPPAYEPTPVPPAAAPVPPQGAAPEPCVLPARLVAPYPISPSAGTELPGDRLVPVGFTWKAVGGADGYVLEVEEKGTDAWLPSVRRPVRSTAAMLEVERLSSSPGALRWRVRAVAGGREGPPCPWVVLR
jgi:hypothetical protein